MLPEPADTPAARVQQFLPLAKHLTSKMHRKVKTFVEFDELLSYAVIGLTNAAHNWNPSRGFKFSSYAYPCINGAIKDGMEILSARYRHVCQPEELVDLGEDMGATEPVGLTDMLFREQHEKLREALEELPVQDRQILLEWADDQTCKDIGIKRGWSKSWASRRRRDALAKLARRMGAYQ